MSRKEWSSLMRSSSLQSPKHASSMHEQRVDRDSLVLCCSPGAVAALGLCYSHKPYATGAWVFSPSIQTIGLVSPGLRILCEEIRAVSQSAGYGPEHRTYEKWSRFSSSFSV